MILILSPIYKAWDKVIEMCKVIDQNTAGEYHHVLCLDSCEMPLEVRVQINLKNRSITEFNDGLSPELHRPCITKALQQAWEVSKFQYPKYDHLFVVESDVMVPKDWDKNLIEISKALPEKWRSLDVLPVDEEGHTTYPASNHNIRRAHEIHGGHELEVVQYGDWNAILFNPQVVDNLGITWRFDDVPSHHDILLSRNFREKMGLERETWEPATFYRTAEVKAVHYANSSRSELPEGLNTPSNPA